jgi:hypothetical protein
MVRAMAYLEVKVLVCAAIVSMAAAKDISMIQTIHGTFRNVIEVCL